MLSVEAIDHIVINVADVESSAAWYERALGMTREIADAPGGQFPRTSMRFGRHKINLRPIEAAQEDWFTAEAPRPGSDDLCFLTKVAPDAVADHFRRCGITIVLGPTMKKGALGPIRSVYVRDPDGNLIEVSSYADDLG
jgi:catechol 2,3-dioxygenase-like lactoylglutathione lyase family enzyme